MTAQNVASLMYDIKEKITDKEFKDIMDALGVVHKTKDRNVYELTYIRGKYEVGKLDDGSYGNMITHRFKTKKVYVDTKLEKDDWIYRMIRNTRNGICYSWILEKQDDLEYPVLCKDDAADMVELEDIHNPKEDCGITLQYDGIILVEIKKL